jgi:mannan endo-1,4-beta-mannosidase
MTRSRARRRPARALTGAGQRATVAAVGAVAIIAAALTGCSQAGPAAAAGGTAPASTSRTTPGPPAVSISQLINPPAGKYFGVEADGPPGSLAPVRAFASLAGRPPDLIGQYVAWGSPFSAQAARSAWSYGALYYMAWEPFTTSVAAIADGAVNGYITRFADAVKAAGVPVALSFGHEFNGNWYPWGTVGTSPASFVTAWRLIHALFAAAGATNVIWVWNPNVISAGNVPLRSYYPGDSYVDWVGLTGYFPASGPTTFDQLFGPTMTEIRQFTARPFIVVETAVQSGPCQVSCVKSLVRGVQRHRDVLGFVWFEFDKAGINWSLQSRPSVRAALAAALARFKIAAVIRA